MRKKITKYLYVFLLLFVSSWVGAQCDIEGQVVEPLNDPACGKMILSYESYTLLVPVNDTLLADYQVNDKINFSFVVDAQQTQPCTAGPPIELTCLNLLPAPSEDCNAEFIHSVNFDDPTSPQVFFVPANFDDALSYTWDFGNGINDNEAISMHVFDGQGYYEVCLTVSDTDCEATYCETLDLHACHASFAYTSDNGVVAFTNLSSGSYTEWQWEMGDGNVFSNIVPTTYDYDAVNIYNVCLTVWNNNGCSNQFCDYVYSGSGDICDFAPCVYPGDANTDGTSNVYDLLPIGVGYGTEGPPRQMDDLSLAFDWSPQFAPDWGLQTINDIDFKHLDCNGDGEVDEDDVAAIKANYSTPTDMFMVQAPGSPTFWLDFEWDTILINDETPAIIELEADLMAGSPNLPIQDLNGFALQLHFDDEMVVADGILVDYNDNSFFGNSNDIIWLQKNREDDGGEFDLGFTRKADETVGFGRIATLKFIIIGDVIARETETEFMVTLEDVVAVNKDGALLTIGEIEPAIVHVVNKTTPTHNEWLNSQVHVFPNPASDKIYVRTEGLQTESAKVFNALGQLIEAFPTATNAFDFDVTGWEKGVYLVQLKTDQGIANKRIVVQ